MRFSVSHIAMAAVFAGGVALSGCANTAATSPYANDFVTYDTDGDGVLDRNEFDAGFARSPYYAGYDTDADGVLNRDEFGVGTSVYGYDYDRFDTDRDGFVNDREYYGGVYGTFDTDGDGVLNRNEFDTGFGPYR